MGKEAMNQNQPGGGFQSGGGMGGGGNFQQRLGQMPQGGGQPQTSFGYGQMPGGGQPMPGMQGLGQAVGSLQGMPGGGPLLQGPGKWVQSKGLPSMGIPGG